MIQLTFCLDDIYNMANVNMPLNKEDNSPPSESGNLDSRDTMIRRVCGIMDLDEMDTNELLAKNFGNFEDFFKEILEKYYAPVLTTYILRIDRFKEDWFKMMEEAGYTPVTENPNFKSNFLPQLVDMFNKHFIFDETTIQILGANEPDEVELKWLYWY